MSCPDGPAGNYWAACGQLHDSIFIAYANSIYEMNIDTSDIEANNLVWTQSSIAATSVSLYTVDNMAMSSDGSLYVVYPYPNYGLICRIDTDIDGTVTAFNDLSVAGTHSYLYPAAAFRSIDDTLWIFGGLVVLHIISLSI